MAKKTQQSPPKSFEDALRELEAILAEIEGGELGLEESLVKYERGNFLIQHCRGVLNTAERQIELLTRNADGELTSAPMAIPVPAGPAGAPQQDEAAGDDEADADADADEETDQRY